MARGQAEHLMPLLEDILSRSCLTWADLSRIGVGIGPGNFTGLRISVSAARGLALGLGIPAVGVSTFDALGNRDAGPQAVVAVPAPRNMAYLASGSDEPAIHPVTAVPPDAIWARDGEAIAVGIARVAARRPLDQVTRPAPLYVRPADAAPARDLPPVILDDA